MTSNGESKSDNSMEMEAEPEGDHDSGSGGGPSGSGTGSAGLSLFTLHKSSEYGQHLQATRDISAGTLILEECPAFYGPSADYLEDYSTPICLGCAVVMNDGNEEYRCPKCKWPLCGPQCDNVSHHAKFECDLFVKEKVAFPPANLPIQNCYKGLTILRGLLLRDIDPPMWEKVMNLQHQNEIKSEDQEHDFSEFSRDFGLPDFANNEAWARILGVLNVNSYSIQRIEKKIGSPSFAEFIYPYQCLMNHSCVPNCNWAITYSPSFTIRARASVDIKKGEMLTVAYNYDLVKYGCQKRQQRIRDQAKFSCRCALCQDETDFGTFSAAVVCFKCKEGFMLPLSPLDPESDWKCKGCSYNMCQSFVSSFVDSLQEQVEMTTSEAEETGEDVVELLEDLVSENSGTVVHPNHWVLTAGSWMVVNHLSTKLKELSLDQLDRFIWHCEHVLKIRGMVTPGISTEKGILQHHIARAKFTKMELAIQQKVLVNSEEIGEEIKMVYSLQKCAALFWKENPHYGTLHANYKQDAQLLMQEMDELRTKYSPT